MRERIGARLVACKQSKQAPRCKSRLIGCHMVGCIVAGMVHKAPPALGLLDTLDSAVSSGAGASGAKSGNGVRAEDHLKSAGDSEIGGSFSWASSVTSPLFSHLPTQHPPYQSRRRLRRLHRSTPSLTKGGAAEVYSISG
jgi:hypothetical protein